MSEKKEKQADAWASWTATLDGDTVRALAVAPEQTMPVAHTPPDEDTDAYAAFRAAMPDDAREWLDQQVDTSARIDGPADTSVARFGIVECPDGDWSMMRLYKSAEGLARRVGQLEGQDMVVWCFFGMPVQITKGKQRYLLLPGDDKAVLVPTHEGGPCRVVEADLLDGVEIQDDGFLGPPELANTKAVGEKLAKTAGSDDDDEEEEGVEA